MLPQQKLILISLISTCIIGSIITFYIYKKKQNVNYLTLLLLVSLLPLISLLRPGSYESGDLSLNVYKTMALYQSLQDGVFPANWAGVLNATYGYPLFNFTYPLPYYSAALFHFFGFSFLDSLKIFIAITFIISGIGMYFFIKTFLPPFYALVGGILFLFAPYHLVDMHFRVDIGEIAAIACIPFVFLFSTKLIQKYNPYSLLYLSLSLTSLVLSHQAISITILPFWSIYIVIMMYLCKKTVLSLLPIFFSVVLACGLSAFYVLPILLELQFTQQSISQFITFEPFWKFIYTPWRYGLLFQGPNGELSFLIGYVQLIMIGISIYLLLKKRLKKPYNMILLFSLFSLGMLLFFMQSISEPLWYIIPLIKNFQFSYRLMGCVIFFTAIIATITAFYIPKKIVYFILFLAIFQSILNWGNRRTIPVINDAYLAKNLPYSTYEGEGLGPASPIWADSQHIWFKTPPKHHLEVMKGKGDIKEITRRTSTHTYIIHAYTPLHLQENTMFFPGWKVYMNEKEIPIHISSKTGTKGVIQFSLPKDTTKVVIQYEPTLPRKIGMIISTFSIIISLGLILNGHRKYSITV